jgi:hypothetical protein
LARSAGLTKGFGLAAFEVNSEKAARSSKTVGTVVGLISAAMLMGDKDSSCLLSSVS